MAYQSLYRKYRSQSFGDLVGQDHVVKALQNAVSRGRIAHAYLFTGPRGTGKTSTARLLAKALNCTDGPHADPPADDPICMEITAGTCLDVQELDAASESGVENVREAIVEASEYKPAVCRYKIFIIDEVHDLSAKAFDALLKTIEEPPPHVIFILATTEYNKVPPTIRSRCQKYEFHRGSIRDLVVTLGKVCEAEGVEIEPAALHTIARMADGGYRDALTLLEQVLLSGEAKVTQAQVYDQLGLVRDESVDALLDATANSDVKAIIEQVDEIYRTGRDPRAIVESMLLRLSDLTRVSHDLSTGADSSVEAALSAAAQRLGADRILRLRGALAEAHRIIRDVSLPRQWLEAELVRIGLSFSQPVAVVQTATPVAAPRGLAPGVGVPVAPRAVVTDSPVEVRSPSPPVPVRAAGSPHDSAWLAVVDEVSDLSKAAASRLQKSRVREVQDLTVVLEFDRAVDADWVQQNRKLVPVLAEKWAKHAGFTPVFRYELLGRSAPAPTEERVAVELPLEGNRLAEAAHEVFSQDGTTEAK